MTTIPGHIKAKRQKLKETQAQFGKRFGKSHAAVSEWESGKAEAPYAVRYIGHPTLELNGPLLDDWAKRVANWLNEGTEVYFFCHCPDERRSPALCRAFQHRLERLADVPPLPWDALDAGMQQASMF
jgi:uncharacterized protein YecE (DUF72 family)